jgi:hypothetical protein
MLLEESDDETVPATPSRREDHQILYDAELLSKQPMAAKLPFQVYSMVTYRAQDKTIHKIRPGLNVTLWDIKNPVVIRGIVQHSGKGIMINCGLAKDREPIKTHPN